MSSDKPECELSPIRMAIEDLVQRQGKSLYEAAFWCIVFAASLVEDRLGRDTRDKVFANAISEMDKAPKDEASAGSSVQEHAAKSPSRSSAQKPAPDYREMLFSILRITLEEIRNAGIPDEELPPALADYSAMIALAMGKETGLEAIIGRLRATLDDYIHHRPPFDECR